MDESDPVLDRVDLLIAQPISPYRTVMAVMGAKKKRKVEISNECARALSRLIVHEAESRISRPEMGNKRNYCSVKA